MPTDKQLLTLAKQQFSGPPSTIEHPIEALSTTSKPHFIHFERGEIINPYRKPQRNENTDPAKHMELNSTHGRPFDTTRPPIVSMTQQSADLARLTEQSSPTGMVHPSLLDPLHPPDQHFMKARLRDSKIMDIVRTYLSFLHDQPPSVCIRGITKISATLTLAAEGLPTDINFLREIFLDVHGELGISRNDALADLQSYRTFLCSERTERLQRTREASLKFYSPPNFRKH